MENDKRSNSALIVVLLVVIVSLIGFVVYDKVLKTSDKCVEIVENKEKILGTEDTNIVVDTPVFGKVTKTVPKGLVGKYVNIGENNSYVEIKNDGIVKLHLNFCEGFSEYSTDKDINYLAFFYELDDGSQRNSMELVMKDGLNYNFGGDGILSLFFSIKGDIKSGNVYLEALSNYGCIASTIYKK